MAIENHQQLTLNTSLGKFIAVYKDGSYKGLDHKVVSVIHTDGIKPIVRQHLDVSGSTAPYVKISFIKTKTFYNMLTTIKSSNELITIKSNDGINCTARLEEIPSYATPSGEMEANFLIQEDRSIQI